MRALTDSPHDWAGVGDVILCGGKKALFGSMEQSKNDNLNLLRFLFWRLARLKHKAACGLGRTHLRSGTNL